VGNPSFDGATGADSLEVGTMNIGLSVFFITLGAILAFAVNATISGLDINVVGYILLFVGIGWLALSLILWSTRRTAARGGALVEERRVYNEPPSNSVYDEPPLP
jgi:hypothetical protein